MLEGIKNRLAIYKKRRGERQISYLVCHMEKYHKTDISPVEKENERDETYQASNPQTDRSKPKEQLTTY